MVTKPIDQYKGQRLSFVEYSSENLCFRNFFVTIRIALSASLNTNPNETKKRNPKEKSKLELTTKTDIYPNVLDKIHIKHFE